MESTAAQLEVRLLGSFRVAVGDRPLPDSAWRRKRAADIVKLLALEPTHRLHREQIVEALWPDLDPDAAANNLRVALHRARQRLEEAGRSPGAFLTRDGDSLVLAPPDAVEVDVDAFEQAVAAAWRSTDPAASERAVELYGGELLPEDRYEEWSENRRAALRAAYLTLLRRTSQLYEQRGELGRAIATLERATTAEPLAEELHAEVIRLLALTGQRRRAMEQVVRLVRTLKRELGAEPQPATRELALAIRDGRFPEQTRALEPPRPAPSLPRQTSGTVTLLVVDMGGMIGGGDREAAHAQEILHRVIEEHGGQMLDAAGDTRSAVFPLAAAALAAALGVREALAASGAGKDAPLRPRFALHSGDAIAGEDNLDAPRAIASALLAAGHDGQMLLSRATQELVRGALPPGIELQDLGEHRLRGVPHSHRVYQLVGGNLPSDFPPLRTPQGRGRALPATIDGLIGRERELAELTHLLAGKRLVTLTGPGGVGKTSLALAVAGAAADTFPDGAALVELASVQNVALIAPAIAHALGVQETGLAPLLESVAAAIEGDRLLLLVDNCEHLTGVAGVLADLLARCPRLTVLATSRSRLRIKGEQEYPVPPLAVPQDEPALPTALPHQVGQPAAVTLFVERARAARPDFALTGETSPAVAEIVRRLDGLPLAIELAAARVRILSPADLLARLARPLDLLTGGPHDAPARHQTLRATIAWSFDLLGTEEQDLFGRLAVFVGGWTLEAAEHVGGRFAEGGRFAPGGGKGEEEREDDGSDSRLPLPPQAAHGRPPQRSAPLFPPSILETLSSLLDQNLVVERRRPDGDLRFGMLETIREFALEQLIASGLETAVRDTHASYYLELGERAREAFKGADQAAWLERIDLEHDNLRAALGWLLRIGAADRALRLAAALWWFWWARGHLSEGRAWLEHVLAASDDAPVEIRARALYGAGSLAEAQGDYERATQQHEEALALYRVAGDQEGIADALASLGQMARDQGNYDEAVRLLDEALATCRAAGDRRGAAYALIELGTVASYRGGGQLALALYTEGLEALRTSRDPRGYAAALTNVATMTFVQGDLERAAPLYEEALTLWRDLGDEQGRATVLTNLGEIMHHRGDLEQAVTLYRDALPIYQQAGDRRNAAAVLANLGQAARDRGDLPTAASLLAGSADIYRAIGDKEAMARALEALAGLAVAMGQAEQGVRLFGRAEALRDEIGAPLAIIAADRYERDVAAARAVLPEAVFAAAWTMGRELPMTEALSAATRLGSGSARKERVAAGDLLHDLPGLLDTIP
jgi:predicted ATPase/DNA-binding SARP family transcriptional activator/Tfp pilus assembly protein PilF